MKGETFANRVYRLNPKDRYFIVFMLYCMLKKEGKVNGHWQEMKWQECLNRLEIIEV